MQQLHSSKRKKRIVIIIAIILTVQAICLCCVSVAFAGEKSGSENTESSEPAMIKDAYEEVFNDRVYASAVNCARWLKDLMDATGEKLSYTGPEDLIREAVDRGILDGDKTGSLYVPLTRDFVCSTLCKAMKYPYRSTDSITDIPEDGIYFETAAYYGWFLPDDDGMIYPEAAVTEDEYEVLADELSRYRLFSGKRMIAFGDSIMYGTGNSGSGIAKIIAEKYGMAVNDYSVPGETMGINKRRGHIPDQIRKAVKDKVRADIILINGGTNDMFLTSLGKLTDGFDMSKSSEDTYTGGFERTMWLIRQNWDVPVVYVRAHNMELGTPENEKKFGERGLAVAEKWGAAGVDIYSQSGLNTEDPIQCELYTYKNPKLKYECDSIHPTALGYAKFYLPFVCEAIADSYTDSIFSE